MTDEELAELKAKEEAEAKAKEEAAAAEAKKKADEDKTKSKLSDAEAKALKEIMKWKEKAKEAEEAKKALEEKYGTLDIDAAKEALAKMEEAEKKELEKRGEYERLLEKQREAAKKEIEAEKKRAAELEANINEMKKAVDELSLGNAFANSKFIQEKLALTPNKTKALYAAYFDIQDGKLVPYDKPKGTPNRTPLVDATGDAMSFDEAIAEIINSDPDKDYLLKAEQKPGAGSRGNTIDPSGTTKQFSDSLEKIAEGLKNEKNFGPVTPKL